MAFIKRIFEPMNLKVTVRESDGYLNATEICNQTGARLGNWLANQSTRDYIAELAKESESPCASQTIWNSSEFKLSENKGLIETKQGRSGGTWIHSVVIVMRIFTVCA